MSETKELEMTPQPEQAERQLDDLAPLEDDLAPAEPVAPEEPVEAPQEPEAKEEASVFVTAPIKPEKARPEPKPYREPLRKRVPLALRGLLQVLSFVLCLVLIVTILGAILVADLGAVFSSGGIKTIINGFMGITTAAPRPVQPVAPAMGRLARFSSPNLGELIDIPFVFDENGNVIGVTDKNGNEITIPSDFFFSEPMEGAIQAGTNPVTGEPIYVKPVVDDSGNLTGFVNESGTTVEVDMGSVIAPDFEFQLPENFTDPEALVDWAYETINGLLGEGSVSRDQVQEFFEESTFSDFIADKVSGYTEDILYGTNKTTINAQELLLLVQENKQLLEEKFDVKISDEQMQEIEKGITDMVGDGSELNQIIQDSIQGIVGSDEPVVGDMTAQDIINTLGLVASRETLWTVLGACLLLVVLMLLLNFYNIPAGLAWVGFACFASGGIMTAITTFLPEAMQEQAAAELEAMTPMILSLCQVLDPIHRGVFFLGVGLLVGTTVWRVVRMVIYNS